MMVRVGMESAFLAFAEEYLGEDVEHFWALREPAVSLQLGQQVLPGAPCARFGGNPLLDPGAEWPCWRDRPLGFVALLDLGQLAPCSEATGLPTEGYLNFFYATDDPDSLPCGDPAEAGGWRVLRSDPGTAVEIPSPGSTVWNAFAAEPVPVWSLPTPAESAPLLDSRTSPSPRSLEDDETEEALEELMEAWTERPENPLDGFTHLVGGWPSPVQPDIPVLEEACRKRVGTSSACAEEELRLLLQLDCDGRITPAALSGTAHFTMAHDWSWGDGGSIYFVISSSDLDEEVFDQVGLLRQTF